MTKKNRKGFYENYCDWCGSLFMTRFKNQKYCKSNECQVMAERIRYARKKKVLDIDTPFGVEILQKVEEIQSVI
ncbi:MAG: hypothetical protein M0R17_07290 [Candidatus Omnitrophica bacterium]|jgi:hypothetical protein|nr:hypothetical protein [Candidatus Omnitrophota bacterium]